MIFCQLTQNFHENASHVAPQTIQYQWYSPNHHHSHHQIPSQCCLPKIPTLTKMVLFLIGWLLIVTNKIFWRSLTLMLNISTKTPKRQVALTAWAAPPWHTQPGWAPQPMMWKFCPPALGYDVHRRDRGSRGGGGMILVKNTYKSLRASQFETERESLRVKLELKGTKPLLIAAYYSAKEPDPVSHEELRRSLELPWSQRWTRMDFGRL